MADTPSLIPRPDVPPRFLETDINRLSKEVSRLKNLPEHRGKSGHEIIRQSVVNYSAPAPSVSSAPPKPSSDKDPLPKYAKDIPPAMKLEVEQLLGEVFTEGIEKASRDAAQSNPYLMDIFHDALTTHLYPELKKRGIVD